MIRIALAIESLVMRTNHHTHVGQVVNEPSQLLAQHRMLFHQGPFSMIERSRHGLRKIDDPARYAYQPYVMQQGADLKNLPLLRRHLQSVGDGGAKFTRAPRLRAEAGVKCLQRLQTKLDRTVEVALKRMVQGRKLPVLFRFASHAPLQGLIQGAQLRIHSYGCPMQFRVAGDQFMALDAILDRHEQFFPQPWLDDKTENLPAVDRFDDDVQFQNSRHQNSGRVRLNAFGMCEKIQPAQLWHSMIS